MSTWMTDGRDTWAYVPADEVDDWTIRGWQSADPKRCKASDFVWMQHTNGDQSGHGGRQKFPAAAVPVWSEMGWDPSPPETPVDLTRDPRLVDVPEEPDLPAPPPATKKSAATSAAKTTAESTTTAKGE